MVAVASVRSELAGSLTEKQWQEQVVALATSLGWRHFHPFDMRRSDTGYPDLTLVRERRGDARLVFAELKRQSGKLTAHQAGWLDVLAATGNRVFVWRPTDFDDVHEVLAARTVSEIGSVTTGWAAVRDSELARMGKKDRDLFRVLNA